MYISTKTLYTDQNPYGGDFKGRILADGDPDSAFLLIAEGAVISEDDAARFGLSEQDGLKPYSEKQALAARESAVIKRSQELEATRQERIIEGTPDNAPTYVAADYAKAEVEVDAETEPESEAATVEPISVETIPAGSPKVSVSKVPAPKSTRRHK